MNLRYTLITIDQGNAIYTYGYLVLSQWKVFKTNTIKGKDFNNEAYCPHIGLKCGKQLTFFGWPSYPGQSWYSNNAG